ncbi:MAG TPA: NAD(P)H-hydrate dehydratase [Opitutaceae bacterium]|nr:NAD(P)H-hydrate dehydratase [Opitutaceae bacterium]
MTVLGDPILTTEEAAAFEARLFKGDDKKEWAAMQHAGHAVAEAVLADFEEIGGFPADGSILVLVGKGHNGGDALLAAHLLLARFPEARATVVLVFAEKTLRTLTLRSLQALMRAMKTRVTFASVQLPGAGYDLSLDGVFGFQFRPPATPAVIQLAARVEALPIRLRAAVDLPSGGLFRADFTYATGIVKSPVLESAAAGRVRYLDLGFFPAEGIAVPPTPVRVLTPYVLAPLAAFRSAQSDKRTYGHVFIVGGSLGYPGAVLMAVLAALRSGVGLVTACVPESLVPAFAARAPEAMWVGWPETPGGGLALEGEHLLRSRFDRATALVVGPGLGRDPETLALVASLVKSARVPVLLDADALRPDIVREGTPGSLVLTPHAGEFARIADEGNLTEFAAATGAIVALKGPVTRVCAGGDVHHSFFGGPVLARGGSGDLLAGLIGGLLAQTPVDPFLATCRGVVWHGLAADLLARQHGQTSVSVTQLLDFLPAALRAKA